MLFPGASADGAGTGAPTGADGAGTGAGAGPVGKKTRVPGLTHCMPLAGRIILGSLHLSRPAGCVVAMKLGAAGFAAGI